jgi:hypothetical protein
MKIGINKLPEAFEVTNEDYFISQINGVTYKIFFKDLLFGLDNVSFSPTISTNSTNIIELSSSVYNLSAYLYDQVDLLESLISTTVSNSFNLLANNLYPVGSIKQTTNPVNPSTFFTGTKWQLLSGGYFIAGTGITTNNGGSYSSGDKNGDIFTFDQGPDTSVGEYSHKLSQEELAAHTHTFSIRLNQTSNVGLNSYQNGPQNSPAMRLDNSTQYTTLSNDSAGDFHNNIPPVYGLYTWQRVA